MSVEQVSPSTEKADRAEKLAICAAAGVDHAWLVNPRARTLEVLRASDVRPTGTIRRSLFRSMLTVKPGTLLAKRLEEDERADRDER